MYRIEYSVLSRIDGVEEWEDKEVEVQSLSAVADTKAHIKHLYTNNMVVFGDIIEIKGSICKLIIG